MSDRSQSRRHIPCAVHRIPRRITVSRTAHGVCLRLLSDTSMMDQFIIIGLTVAMILIAGWLLTDKD